MMDETNLNRLGAMDYSSDFEGFFISKKKK